jgi:Domain of unknown function (DUF4397)
VTDRGVTDRGVTARHRKSGTTRRRRLAGALGSGGVALLLLVAALLVGPGAALAQAPAQQTPTRQPGTLVRLAQLQADLMDVELVVSSVADSRKSVVSATLHYGDVSDYRPVEPGDYVVSMRPAGSTEPPKVSKTVSVQPGMAYTLAAVRHDITPDDIGVFTDDLSAPAAGKSRVRVINAVSAAPELDVRDADDQPVVLALPLAQASPYREVASGAMQWKVGPPAGPATPLSFGVQPNQVASVVLTGDGGPRATVVVDAGGPAVVPPGPVHAGFGGTAGPEPGGAVGSGVLAVLGAVAAGVSVRLARAK